jgi:hypothetical protein
LNKIKIYISKKKKKITIITIGKRAATEILQNVTVIDDNVVAAEIPDVPATPGALSVKSFAVSVSNDGVSAFSDPIAFAIADAKCQVAIGTGFTLKVIIKKSVSF